ncbi:site-specific DNA-methyltransferase [Streptococcus oralis]|uniref:site-specific DNA-methyltransferase n=1 Tax=Streptococcus oralis TaxID=1303 RepID=UPI0020C90C46|nr:site-specific DNA-methyltransferase [Streptococcus oralis]MCP9038727.1 site-specific DNA-methyltransferase [Streptococcus oralis]MCP9053672.1 site-specific DNA-methyltransferase [Streptococcus oralis]MCP9059357.1 site-specific DNA-methyltransferase [Streptococcus oralis]MCP9066916.1 site-specific DNA-methyltransferase [Streptococcus oralis]MCP9070849.1 site-specific DNA-methyltransferase [Streptococcus oralis]
MNQAFETAIQQALQEVVESFDEQYVAEGLLKKGAIIVDLDNYKPELVEKILTNAILNEAFTEDIAGATILKINDIIQMLEVDEYWSNSYTRYTNKIGLFTNNRYLDEVTDVVLNFPYKDGILKAGMTKDDVSREDAEESFLNEIVAREEIDVLLDEKIFKNAKKYDKNDSSPVSEIKDTDNLIIKGNNLLALHSLKKRFSGKIKTVFIDPPYYFLKTKPTDTFTYNSNFSLSSWLTFLKNRLSIAYQLLSYDGLLFLSMSDEGTHYLKVMIDEIFGMENFIADVTWEARSSVSSDGLFSMNSNHILVYAKNKDAIDKNDFRLALDIETFKYNDNDGRGPYRLEPFDAPKVRKNLQYKITNPNTGDVYIPPKGRHWRTTKENYERWLADNRIRFGVNGTSKPQLKAYYSEVKMAGKGKASSSIWTIQPNSITWRETNTNTSATKHQQELFGEEVFTNPKPEELIKRVLELSTNEGDLVLDFFMGSGTTAAVAHKMNRQYIGIEQMDYIDTVAVERLKKVIDGEQGGISQDVAWSGGGSFIYAELMDKNATFIDAVLNSKHSDELKAIFDDMKATLDFDFRVDLQEVDQSIWDEDFEMQKKILVKIIDKNQLYHNYSEIDDETIKSQLSQSDYDFNKSFYGEK